MFSKKAVRAVLLVSLVGALASCNSNIGEPPPPPASQEFSGTQCLSAVRPVVADFVQGRAQQRDIEASWDCAQSALEKFKRYVRGRTSDRYSSQELATFLESNFLNNEKISVGLQTEFMKVKQLFVGGSGEYLTRDEIDRLSVLFGNFSDISVRINPYMKVLVMNWSAIENSKVLEKSEYFEQANIEIQNAARSIGALIEQNGRGYILSDFVVLSKEIGQFIGEDWAFPKTLETYMPLVQKVKKALAGGDENTVVPSEWSRFLVLGSRAYVQYLRYFYFIKSAPETGMAYRLSYLATSAEDLLSMFADFVSEKPGQRITTQELGEFLNTLGAVWPTFKTSDRLLLESMKIKKLLFGGDLNQFTIKDFENARGKVGRIKDVTEKFLPYYPVYTGEWDPSSQDPKKAEQYFVEARKSLEISFQEAARLFEDSYDLKDLVSLLEEVQRLYPPEPGNEGLATELKKYIPLVVDTKNMIFGTKDTVLHKQHWPILADLGGRLYGEYLYYSYFIKDKDSDEVRTLVSLSKFSNQALDIVRDLISQKKEGYFTKAELSKLISHLVKLGFVPDDFSDAVVSNILDVVLNRVLVAPERRLNGASPNVLNKSAIEVARQELQIWLDTQTWVLDITKDIANEGFGAARMVEFLRNAKDSRSSSPALKIGAGELLLTVSSPVTMTYDKQGRLNISNRRTFYYNARSMTQLNLNRTITRILLRSFVNSRDRLASYSGATVKEMQTAFDALRPVMIQLGMIDKKNTTFASSRHREANIFMPHSDGNNLMSFAEGADMVGMIWSGLSINKFVKAQLVRECLGRSSAKGSTLISVNCAADSYRRAFVKYGTSMPEHVRFVNGLTKEMWYHYIGNVFKSAGYIPNAKGLATLDDITLSPHVMQYVEMIYSRFDKDKNDYIDTDEAIKAFPTFKGIMLELAADQLKNKTITEAELVDVFGFILRYGHPPTSIWEKLKYVTTWRGKPKNWDIWAGRTQLAEILGYIADEVSKAAKAKREVKMDFNLDTSGGR